MAAACSVSGAALARIQLERKQANRSSPVDQEQPPPTPSLNLAAGARRSRRTAGSARTASGHLPSRQGRPSSDGADYTFGAVYQYHDSTGKPKLVASTAELPERAYARDLMQNTEVARLLLSSPPQQRLERSAKPTSAASAATPSGKKSSSANNLLATRNNHPPPYVALACEPKKKKTRCLCYLLTCLE